MSAPEFIQIGEYEFLEEPEGIYDDSIDISDPCEEDEDCLLYEDEDVWIKTVLESTTESSIQEIETTRDNLLYGEQFDLLPHIRCYQCGKIIGHLWETYLRYAREKYYDPEEIIDLLGLTEEEKSLLIEAYETDQIAFQELLVKLGVKNDYNELSQKGKYLNRDIFEKLNLKRPCCRMNLMTPIHVPIKQKAFSEKTKTTEVNNTLLDVQMEFIEVKQDRAPEERLAQEELNISAPLIPITEQSMKSACKIKTSKIVRRPLKVTQVSKLRPEEPEGEELMRELADAEIGEVEKPEEPSHQLVAVGEEFVVERKPRRFRAR